MSRMSGRGAVRALLGLGALLAGLCLVPNAYPADGELDLSVDAPEVGIDDTFLAVVTASGDAANAGEPHLELGSAFRVVGSGRSQSISFVNGRTSVEVRWQYTLQPMREGNFEVGPALLKAGGRDLRSGKVEVRVVPGSVAPPREEAFDPWSRLFGGPRSERRRPVQQGKVRLVATIDKKQAYVGEQVNYTLRLLTQLEVRTVKPRTDPQLTGFWAETVEVPNPPTPERVTEGGEAFTSYLLKKAALFPTAPGRVEIPPAVWDLSVLVPNGFFGDPSELSRSTDALAVEVLPFPEEGKPEGFSGAVGEFELEAAIDKAEARVGEALALKVTLSGSGNLKTLPAPAPPAIPDARSYSSTTTQSIQTRGGKMSGSRTWEFVIVPNAPGEQTVPAIRYPYFVPGRRAYRVAETRPIAIRVSKAEGGEAGASGAAPVPSGPLPAGARKAIEPVRRDVAYLKLEAPGLGEPRLPLHRSHVARASLALPVVLNVAALLYQWGRRRERGDPTRERRRGARRAAEARLEAAAKAAAGKARSEVPALVAEALTGYVADRRSEPAAGLTRERLAEMVAERAGDARAKELTAFLDRCDYLAFTPAAGAGAETTRLVSQAKALLRALDKAFSRERS